MVLANSGAWAQSPAQLPPLRTDTCRTPGCFYDIGNRHFSKGTDPDYGHAFRAYSKGLKLAEQTGDSAAILRGIYLVGGIYDAYFQLDRAEHYYRRFLEMNQAARNQAGIAKGLHALHILAWKGEDYSKALHLIREAVQENTRSNDSTQQVEYLLDYARQLEFADSISAAAAKVREAERIYAQMQLSEEALHHLSPKLLDLQTRVLVCQGRPDKANDLRLEYLQRNQWLTAAERYPIWERISDYYADRGDFRQAYAAKDSFIHWLTVFRIMETRNMDISWMVMFETERLEAEKRLSDEMLAREQEANLRLGWSLGGLGLLAAGLAAALVLLARARARTKSVNQRLLLGEAQLRLREREKAILYRELHHRLKNNLQMLSSMLYLQAEEKRHTSAYGELAAAHRRVEAMALVHRDLYRKDDVSQINLREYLSDLAHAAADGHSARPVHLNLSIPNLVLETDKAIQLGMIVNELITNSCKHAPLADGSVQIYLRLNEPEAEAWALEYSDNGPGPGPDIREGSFGMRMIGLMAEQLKATTSVTGSHWTFRFAIQPYEPI